jgi:YD repeat-containing protein
MRTTGLGLVAGLSAVPAAAFGQASASNYTYATRYDFARHETGTIAPDADGVAPFQYAAVRKTYNAAGLVSKVESGSLSSWQGDTVAPASWGAAFTVFNQVETYYDGMNRKQLELVRTGGVIKAATHYSYTLRGLLQCTAMRMNPTQYDIQTNRNLSACALGPQGSDGPDRITLNTYNLDGQVTAVTKAYLITTANGFPQTLQQDYASYEYSPNGKVITMWDANHNRSEMTYDGLDLQDKWIFPSATNGAQANQGDYEQYGYDANGNRTSLRKRDGTTLTYKYDALNRLAQKRVPDPATGAAATATADCHTTDPSDSNDVCYGYDNRGLQVYVNRPGFPGGSNL